MRIPWIPGAWALVILTALTGCSGTSGDRPATTIHVSTTGDDAASGDASHPVATLAGALGRLRAIKAAQGLPTGGVTIRIGAGIYEVAQSLTLGADDGGTAQAPILFEPEAGQSVWVRGGRTLPAAGFEPVTDPSVLGRLDPAAAANILHLDLGALGIQPAGARTPHGYWHPVLPAASELFLDGQPLTLARWPDSGWASMTAVVDPGSIPRDGDASNRGGTFSYSGDRPSRWQEPASAWVTGFFHWPWADDSIRIAALDPAARTITLADPHLYGLALGQPSLGYYIENVLEELDQPGEWFLDAAHGQLYLWPPEPLPGHEPTLSLCAEPLISIVGASHVTFRNLHLECGRGMGVYMASGSHNTIDHCTIRDFGTVGVQMGEGILGPAEVHYFYPGPKQAWPGQVGDILSYMATDSAWDSDSGSANGVVGCRISELGAGGIILGGGNRKNLSPGGNYLTGNEISNTNRLSACSRPGILVHGVGASLTHNSIHDMPQMAIGLSGNDHQIAFNEIFNAVTFGNDIGAVYCGRNPSERGNVIQSNYFHDIGNSGSTSTCAVYLDDGQCGVAVQGNVFYRAGGSSQGSVFVNGGFGHRIMNNVFVEDPLCIGLSVWPEADWLAQFGPGTLWERYLLQDVDIQGATYLAHYPELAQFYGAPAQPLATRIDLNLAVQSGRLQSGQPGWCTLGSNLETGTNPGFVDPLGLDWTLRGDSMVFGQLNGFMPIPFHSIGPASAPGAQP